MRSSRRSSPPLFYFLIFLVLVSFTRICVEARIKNHHHHHHQKSKHHHKGKNTGGGGGGAAPLPPYKKPDPTTSNIFDILSFGAKGDGVSDDSKAVASAWKAACKIPSATLRIPSEYKFLVSPITLRGPCMPQLVLQIDGTLLAPPKVGSWRKSDLYQWLNFKWVHNFTIQGTGTVDGQGPEWWSPSQTDFVKKRTTGHIPKMKPTAIRFYASYNVTVRDIRIINSPLCHLKFDSSAGIQVINISISSPEDSPNTDGIHLQNTRDVEIQHSSIASGDDCVSIQTGCSNVHVHHINCGPGHGISIGGLGKDRSSACVSNITVEDISMDSTMYGLRIKTWQGGSGSVRNVTFSRINVSDVRVPIMIDQYYCDKGFCRNQTRAVAISDVKYNQIIGTYSNQPINLSCSSSIPCMDVDLIDIQLKPSSGSSGFQQAFCWNSYGKTQNPLVPSSIDYCLRKEGSDSVRRVDRSYDYYHKTRQ